MKQNEQGSIPWQRTLPGHYYYDEAIYQREREQLWEKMWVCVGRADDAAAPGQFYTREVGSENVIVVRDRDGKLRAFLNVCRHRGARLCTQSCGQLKNSIQCKYHAWTYGLDGRLRGAPNVGQEVDLKTVDLNLISVALEEYAGYVWLNLLPNPQPLWEQIEPHLKKEFSDLSRLERFGIRDLKVGKRIEYHIAANWKLGVENFLECYHCAPMHPELCGLLPNFRKSNPPYEDEPGDGIRFAPDVEAFTLSGRGWRRRLPNLLDSDDRRYHACVLPPNVFLNLLPDHVIVHVEHPAGPRQTRITCDWLFHPDAMAEPGFDADEVVQTFDLVNRQDWEVCELAQQGIGSRAFRQGGYYVNCEAHIAAFRDMILERVG
jgi:Rieske 2Fe-2S family protein